MIEFLRNTTTWFTLALVLGILEVLIPGFLFLGFAFGAAVVGLLLMVIGPESFPGAAGLAYLASAWGLASIVAWAALRRWFVPKDAQTVKTVRHDINEAPYKGDRD